MRGSGIKSAARSAPAPRALSACLALAAASALITSAPAPTAAAPPSSAAPAPPQASTPARCLESGDGYLRAHLAGAIEAHIDWPNRGTRCEGESREGPTGVRLSFHRSPAGKPDLLFVFGISGVHEGRPAQAAGTNLTLIVQGTDHIYGTLGDSRCTVDSLDQRRVGHGKSYRVEARGFCTQPAHAVRGEGDVLVSTFEFAGLVNYEPPKDEVAPGEVIFPHGDRAPDPQATDSSPQP
jgi:hypothetical protein